MGSVILAVGVVLYIAGQTTLAVIAVLVAAGGSVIWTFLSRRG